MSGNNIVASPAGGTTVSHAHTTPGPDGPTTARPGSLQRVVVLGLLLTCVLGVAATGWLWRVAEKRRAAAASQAENNQRLAVTGLRLALESADQFSGRIAEDASLRAPEAGPARRALLDQAIGQYDQVAKACAEVTTNEYRLWQARAIMGIARARRNQGLYDKARERADEAIQLLDGETGTNPEVLSERIRSRSLLAGLLEETGALPQAADVLGKAIELAAALDKDHPSDVHKALRIGCHRQLGMIEAARGRGAQAEKEQQTALELVREVVVAHPNARAPRSDEASLLQLLGSMAMANSKTEEAGKLWQESLSKRKALVNEAPTDESEQAQLAAVYHDVGLYQREVKKWKDAESAWEKAVAIWGTLARKHPFILGYRYDEGVCRHLIGTAQVATNRPKEAEKSFLEALVAFDDILLKQPAFLGAILEAGTTTDTLTGLLDTQGRRKEMLPRLDASVARLSDVVAREPKHAAARATLLENLVRRATVLQDFERDGEAAVLWKRALELETGDRKTLFKLNYAGATAAAGKHTDAAALVVELLGKEKTQGWMAHHAAKVYLECARSAESDPDLPRADRATAKKKYHDEAMKLLLTKEGIAHARTESARETILKNEAWKAVRDHADFAKLQKAMAEK